MKVNKKGVCVVPQFKGRASSWACSSLVSKTERELFGVDLWAPLLIPCTYWPVSPPCPENANQKEKKENKEQQLQEERIKLTSVLSFSVIPDHVYPSSKCCFFKIQRKAFRKQKWTTVYLEAIFLSLSSLFSVCFASRYLYCKIGCCSLGPVSFMVGAALKLGGGEGSSYWWHQPPPRGLKGCAKFCFVSSLQEEPSGCTHDGAGKEPTFPFNINSFPKWKEGPEMTGERQECRCGAVIFTGMTPAFCRVS